MAGQDSPRVLDALCAVANVLSTQYGQRRILSVILECLEQRLGMKRGTILLVSPDGSELLVETAGSETSPRQQDVRYQRGEGVVGRVLQRGQPAVVPRIADEPQFRDRIHRRAGEAMNLSFICVPILLGSEIIGTLSVDLPLADPVELQENQQLLTIVASMVAGDVKLRRRAQQERQALEDENLRLRGELGERIRPENMTGGSPAMRRVYLDIQRVAGSDTNVLIRGESGTGKELVASAIHYASGRSARPFIKVNCAALSETLIESELFGHEQGAFTGATRQRAGRIEEAQGGTLFLDEIGDFSPAVQVKLLRVLQERQFERVGGNATLSADVRFIAATNRDLEAAVEDGSFRQDLYYRINVFAVYLPALRERKEDIVQLADHFVRKFAARMGKDVRRISTAAVDLMLSYHWPGNVRELENCIERAVLLSTDGVIHAHDLPPSLQRPEQNDGAAPGTLPRRVDLVERDLIIDALKRHNGRVDPAAADLGITSRMLRYRLKRMDLAAKEFRRPAH